MLMNAVMKSKEVSGEVRDAGKLKLVFCKTSVLHCLKKCIDWIRQNDWKSFIIVLFAALHSDAPLGFGLT